MDAIAHTTRQNSDSNHFIAHISKVFVIAYKESTQLLEKALMQEGLEYQVLRQEHREEFQGFSPSYLCLLNHQRAWEKATRETKPVLIVEADFVPVLGFSQLPLPFDPNQSNVGVAWLYTCAPQIYSVSREGYAEGYSASTVAYVVTARSARCLLDLVEEVKEQAGPTAYSAWDSRIDKFLRVRGFKNYIPFRNYGEHGGRPNPEHRQNGLSNVHRADVLYGKLAFLPLYASEEDGRFRFLLARLQARCKGVARLAAGSFLRVKILKGSNVPARLLSFAVRRQISMHL